MANYGPPGGPLSGGMASGNEFASDYNKAAQAKQKEIFEAQQAAKEAALDRAATDLAKDTTGREQSRQPERSR